MCLKPDGRRLRKLVAVRNNAGVWGETSMLEAIQDLYSKNNRKTWKWTSE